MEGLSEGVTAPLPQGNGVLTLRRGVGDMLSEIC